MPTSLIASAPTRIDLGGGWTDVPPYPEELGGVVCNVAISRRATVRLERDATTGVEGVAQGESALVRAALARAGDARVRVTLASDYPVGAGLGGSSAAGVAVVGALAMWNGESLGPEATAERSRTIEVEDLGVAGGRQDHYAAVLGGALCLRFTDRVSYERILLPPSTAAAFARRALLVYTGESRISGETITAVLDGYRTREARVLDALAAMKGLAVAMAAALRAGDLDQVGMLVGEHWAHQRGLHPGITTARIDEIVRRATEAGAHGAKALGASGGGCVVVFAPDAAVPRVRAAIAPLGTILEYAVDLSGLTVAEADGVVTDRAGTASGLAAHAAEPGVQSS